MESQDFEIITEFEEDYHEVMDALDNITDFKILESSFISDEYIIVRTKAFDRLKELYGNTKKFKKMVNLWKNTSEFIEPIPFLISELGRNNNIESTISYILHKYEFTDYKPVGNVVHVSIIPSYNFWDSSERVKRHTQYGIQYQYELIIRVLVENINHTLWYDYRFVRCWNVHNDTHKGFYEKLVYKGVK